ncbi:MAG: acylphosphatase [Lentimicrobium sp.]|jgi:acylphosphatase|nr:acylphosphatase [Lentimicrobium sp.]MDD2527781.1 acylphosphatase [Lentimicrobiaceae bacterium]MDD4598272.1 acylphosphatase [Lentimicrobiaceae bacterium]MDY0025710.1 acylphosphatase [Lentimicrobium sp.]HAH57094.1 acylphosphatase [Bacteroidales bacterium]
MKKRIQIYITGNVQRIGFRVQAAENAVKFNIFGKAMYIDDGILIDAEGEPEPLNQFLAWCRKGPENCTIDTFAIHEMQPINYSCFEIIHGVVSSESIIDKFPVNSPVS